MNEKYNILLDNMFSADFNVNDFFFYSTAQSISVAREDFPWVILVIQYIFVFLYSKN